MILVLDLDDTLYDESSFVTSGLGAVARYGYDAFGWGEKESFDSMSATLQREGRGRVFDRWLEQHGRLAKGLVAECVRVYRHHRPALELFPAALRLFGRHHGVDPLYLITDGHKVVQRNKVDALGLAPLFRRVLITHRFGVVHAKPSVYCFDLIRRAERCGWEDVVYVGDDPSKDFVGLNPLGVLTVRVLTGRHATVNAAPGCDALVSIPDLDALPGALATRFRSDRAGAPR